MCETQNAPAIARYASGFFLAVSTVVTSAVLLGRSLAYCAHPAAAWRRLCPTGRISLLTAYAAAGYLVTLLVLLTV